MGALEGGEVFGETFLEMRSDLVADDEVRAAGGFEEVDEGGV